FRLEVHRPIALDGAANLRVVEPRLHERRVGPLERPQIDGFADQVWIRHGRAPPALRRMPRIGIRSQGDLSAHVNGRESLRRGSRNRSWSWRRCEMVNGCGETW